MARESRSRDKKEDEKPTVGSAAAPSTTGTSLTVTLSNPLSKKRKRRPSATATVRSDGGAAEAANNPSGMAREDRLLGPETREAIVLVLDAMRHSMPMNTAARDILTLALPPSFATTPENTLANHLQSTDLTRSALSTTLSTLATHLLKSTTPSPFRREPVNSLTLEKDQRAIYQLFRGVHNVLESLPASTSTAATTMFGSNRIPIKLGSDRKFAQSTSFALTQTIPSNGQNDKWFTTAISKPQAAELVASSSKEEDTQAGLRDDQDISDADHDVVKDSTGVRKILMCNQNLFGNAVPVSIHDTLASVATTSAPAQSTRTLGDSVYQKASLNVEKFKSQRALRRKRLFGAITHTVDMSSQSRTSWHPSFGMTHDSTSASGGWGYMSSSDMGYRNGTWNSLGREQWGSRVSENAFRGERGHGATVEDVDMDEAGQDVASKLLIANGKRLHELSEWQTIRIRRGDPHWVSDREASVAREVLDTLATLAGDTQPLALLSSRMTASELAAKVVHTSAPHIRGLLDPKRPRAIADDGTLKLLPRSQVVPTNQNPQQRYASTPYQRTSTPQQYTPGPRPQQLHQQYAQQPQRLSTPQPSQHSSAPFSPYNRVNNTQTTLQRPNQLYTPQQYVRPIHSAAAPTAQRPAAPLAAASAQPYGSQSR